MAVRENNQMRGMARGAVVVAAVRSGGTFLAHCLSNHSQVFCDRGEPLHHSSVWCAGLKPDRRRLLAALLNQTGYLVSMCKLTYTQALHREIWAWLVKRQPLVVWLRRENVVRQAVSVLINREARAGRLERAQHTFTVAQPVRVAFAPEVVLRQARGLAAADERAGRMLRAMERVLALTYADVVGGEEAVVRRLVPETARRVCEFLGVRVEGLECDLERVNPYPLGEMLSNWREVETTVRGSELAGCLADG